MQRVGVEKMTGAKSFRRILLEEKGHKFLRQVIPRTAAGSFGSIQYY
jgi:hypothetical protein